MTEQDKVLEWYETERGITRDTLAAFGVTVDADGNTNLPYSNGEKVRPNPTRPLGEKPRFSFTRGRAPALFGLVSQPGNKVAFLCEGETDTMRLWQAAKDENAAIDVFGLGGLHTWKPEFVDQLAEYAQVMVILDNDTDYKVAATVDHVWLHQIRHDLGPKAKRLRLPEGVKDVCEFFSLGFDFDILRDLSKRTQSRFRPLNLTIEPPPVNWLLEGLVAKGDVNLGAGGEGLGKSMITMALTVAVADSHPTALGLRVMNHGRVLYVDEENPYDVVYHRLNRMGLKNHDNVRYLWNNGIRLDRDPDEFLAEALDFQPQLIVLDSLSRLHGLEENDMGSIGPLFNDVLRPLARESGAAVFLIHHHDKAGIGPRGSGDIAASVDSVINFYPTAVPGEMTVQLKKSRRRLGGDQMKVKIVDRPDGTLALEAVNFSETSI